MTAWKNKHLKMHFDSFTLAADTGKVKISLKNSDVTFCTT